MKDLEAVSEGERHWRKLLGVDDRAQHRWTGPHETEHFGSRDCLVCDGLLKTQDSEWLMVGPQ